MARLDILRIYDQSVMDMMLGSDQLTVVPVAEKNDPPSVYKVPAVFATPERAEGGIRGDDWRGDSAISKAPYPYFSVSRVGWAYDWTRRNPMHVRYVSRSSDQKTHVQARFPFPIDLYYQIDFWARKRTHGNLAQIWLAEQFPFEGGEGRIFNIDFKVPWGEKWIRGFIQDIQDLTVLESGEDEREIRITCKFVMKGHLFQCFESVSDITYDTTKITYRVPTILSAQCEILDEGTNEVLDTIVAPEGGGQFQPDGVYP